MKTKHFFLVGMATLIFNSCTVSEKEKTKAYHPSSVQVAGAMKNVMRKGQLQDRIALDTIKDKKGVYGLGPNSHLRGELLVMDGQVYVSKVGIDSSMVVETITNGAAPFFVYAKVSDWKAVPMPEEIKNIEQLQNFLEQITKDIKTPFAFRLAGQVAHASIHIQNLPKGTRVTSPQEAHQGQKSYKLVEEPVEVLGFYSTQHQGVFTHHDSYIHMHLINEDKSKMGHLDGLEMEEMVLYLPKD